MTRGPKKHFKRIAAPKHWCLDKLGGIYAPHPSSGPHKKRECLPILILIRNRLRYAMTYKEANMVVMQRAIKVDDKVRTDICFPCGFQDVIKIEKTNDHFRLLYDTKGRFLPHKIHPEEAKYKLCRIRGIRIGLRGIPEASTHDGRTIRHIHPDIRRNDTIRLDVSTGKVLDFIKFDVGRRVMITGGHNIGRVGVIVNIEKHPGSVEMIHIRDAVGHQFATRVSNVFVIGTNDKYWITLPKGSGVKKTIVEEREERLRKHKE